MAEVYEFHVAGAIGPVVRAALPELSSDSQNRNSVLTGTAESPEAVEELLRRICDAGLTTTHILINREGRWRSTAIQDATPAIDDVP